MTKVVLFTNWSKEDFTHTWASEAYNFPAGETQPLPEYLAFHFAKHLAVRELNKIDKDGRTITEGKIEEYMGKALGAEIAEGTDNTKMMVEALKAAASNKEEVKEVKPKAKPGRKPKTEEVKEGLNPEFKE